MRRRIDAISLLCCAWVIGGCGAGSDSALNQPDDLAGSQVNKAFIVDPGPNQVTPDSGSTGEVQLDASKVSIPDSQIKEYLWLENGNTVASGVRPVVTFSSGVHVLTLRVIDDQDRVAEALLYVSVGGVSVSGTVARVAVSGSTGPTGGLVLMLRGIDGSAGFDLNTTTDANGNFSTLVPVGWSGTVGSDANYELDAPSTTLTNVTAPVSGLTYTAFQNYYVATTGSDSNPGTDVLPFATIQKAVNSAQAGETCVVRAGSYTESVNIVRSGSADKPITIRSYPGEVVILDGNSKSYAAFQNDARSHIVIDGFVIRNYGAYGVLLVNNANYCTIRNCEFSGCRTNAILLRGADYFEVSYNDIHDNFSTGAETNWRDTTGNFAEHGVFSHNLVHNNGSFAASTGPDGLAGPGAHDCTWEYNIVYNNADDGIDISSGGGGTNYPNRATVRYNICFQNGINPSTGLPGNAAGNGIKISTNAGGGHLVHHNICYLNKRGGFDQDMNGAWDGNSFYNNVAWRNGTYVASSIRGGFLIEGGKSEKSRATLMNNIAWGNDPASLAGYNTRGDFFTDNLGVGISDSNSWGVHRFVDTDPGHDHEGPHSIVGSDPQFTDPDAPIDTNYTGADGIRGKWQFLWNHVTAHFSLSAGSPCVDAGTALPGVTDGYAGNAPDMGAVERAP